MRRFVPPWMALVLLLAASTAASAGQFILRARTTADADTLCRRYGLIDVRLVHQQGPEEVCLVLANTQSAAEDSALRALVAADPLTVSIETDTSLALAESTSAGPALAQSTAAILEAFSRQAPVAYFGRQMPGGYVSQPAAGVIRLADAQQLATGGGVVAIIDTGIDPGHPALADVVVPGYDFVNDVGGVPTDFADLAQSTAAILEQLSGAAPNSVAILNQSTAAILEQATSNMLNAAQLPAAFGHGTMVAGLVHLVAPTASIMPLKAFRADGNASMSDLVSAIYYAVDHGATVINMSFTLAGPSQSLLDAITYAASQRTLLVAAVGNGGSQMTTYPASWPGVIAVASTTLADQRSVFSNYGRVDLSAPGEALITAYPGNHYAAVWGTSFSTALVSGAAALLQQWRPGLTEANALKVLEQGASVPSSLGKARLDLHRALVYLFHELN
ncbi:MAG TPA: S8 family serine peptidase [Vicinamibacterales bacterium]